jgi:LacI family transcriptional regulator
MGSEATLRDVALHAGVSLGTASLALNNRPSVAPETRAKVVEAANQLGYVMRTPTRMAGNASAIKVIGMLVKHDLGLKDSVNPFYSYVQLGVESEARKLGIDLMYSTIDVDSNNTPVALPGLLESEQIDALLVVGVRIDEHMLRIQRLRNLPMVLIDSSSDDELYDSIQIDNFGGSYRAVRLLTEQGHRAIGLIGSRTGGYSSIRERRRGYLAALESAGVADPNTYIEESRLNRHDAYDATVRLVQRAPELSAIFACNDECAFGVLDAIRDLGLRVPHDLCVVGFDDLDLAREMRPALTTVHVHKAYMGVLGVRLLLQRNANPDQPASSVVVSTRLIDRETVCDRSRQTKEVMHKQ